MIFDVTNSAFSKTNVGIIMKGVWERLLDDYGDGIDTVLDFGAGKFRNTFYFLNKGKQVTAVEFKDLAEQSDDAKEMLEKCEKKGNFHHLVFPYPFIGSKGKYDLVILVNVVPVMPVSVERLLLLDLLYDRVNENKYVLWYTMPEGEYKVIKEEGNNNFGDGLWMGEKNKHKTFYKFHTKEDIIEMFSLYGFELVKKIPASGNDVLLFKKTPYNLLKGMLTPEKIISEIPKDENFKPPSVKFTKVVQTEKIKEIIPDPYCFSIQKLYSDSLKSIPKGKNPDKYHRLVSLMVLRIFRDSLYNMSFELDKDRGLKYVDTVFSFYEEGFFGTAIKKHKISCNYIVLEAKNYAFDIKNEEFDQIGERLDDHVGKFGLLVCRSIKNKDDAMRRCEALLNDGGKHIIILTDDEILNLLDLSIVSDRDAINQFMDQKFRALKFRSKK